MSRIRGIPDLSDSLTIEPHILLCHYCDVVLLARVLSLFVEVDQFLVQQPIEQFEILQTCLDIAVFREAILSGADVVQKIHDFVVARRLSRVVLEDSAWYVRRSIWCYFRYQICSPRELDLLLGKSRSQLSLSLRKSRICFVFELSNLFSHIMIVRLIFSCQSTDKILPRICFILMSDSEKLSLLMKQSISSFRAEQSDLLVLVV